MISSTLILYSLLSTDNNYYYSVCIILFECHYLALHFQLSYAIRLNSPRFFRQAIYGKQRSERIASRGHAIHATRRRTAEALTWPSVTLHRVTSRDHMAARRDRAPHLSPSGSAVSTMRVAAATCHPIFRPRAREGLILRTSFVVTTMFLSCQAFSPKLWCETHLSLAVVLVPRCLYPLGKKMWFNVTFYFISYEDGLISNPLFPPSHALPSLWT